MSERHVVHLGQLAGDFTRGLAAPAAPLAAVSPLIAPDSSGDWSPVDLCALRELPPELPTVGSRADGRGLFYAGKINSAFGESFSGKTWAALLAAGQVLADGGRVVYVDFEDSPRGMAHRLGVVGAEALDRLTYVNPSSYARAGRDSLAGVVEAAELVVIDATTAALSAMGGLSSNSDTDVELFMAELPRWAARLGPAVVVIDHVAKDASNRNGAQGSQHKRAAISGASYLVQTVVPFAPGVAGHAELVVNKDRPGGVGAMGSVYAELAYDGQGFTLRLPTPKTAGPDPVSEAVTTALAAAGGALPSLRALYRAIEGSHGYGRDAVARALAGLTAVGWVEVEDAGRGKPARHALTEAFAMAHGVGE